MSVQHKIMFVGLTWREYCVQLTDILVGIVLFLLGEPAAVEQLIQ